MKKIILLLILCLCDYAQGHKKVLLADVTTITLKAGQYTTGRRSNPVPQIKCVGGAAAHKYQPKVAQCTKVGFDGLDYQWRCTAEMPTDYEFGKITVSCEGYDHPDDPYILHGSCGLEYELEYTSDLKRHTGPHDTSNTIGTYIVVALIVFVLLYMLFNRGSRGFDGGPGYPPGPDGPGYPDKPRNPSPPPSYDESVNNTRRRNQRTGFGEEPSYYRTMGWGSRTEQQEQAGPAGGPGFWTGAGLGALGGYLFGRNQNAPRRTATPNTYTSSYRQHTPPPSSSSSSMHDSTGYGGTSRR